MARGHMSNRGVKREAYLDINPGIAKYSCQQTREKDQEHTIQPHLSFRTFIVNIKELDN